MPSSAANADEQKAKRSNNQREEPTLDGIANLKGLQQQFWNLHAEKREFLGIQEQCDRRIRSWKNMGLTEDQVAEETEKKRNARDIRDVVVKEINTIQPQLEYARGEMTGDKTVSCSKDPLHWNTEPTQEFSSSDKGEGNATNEEDSSSEDNNDSKDEVWR